MSQTWLVVLLCSDYGYYREDGSEDCVRDPEFKGAKLDICLRGHEEEIISEGFALYNFPLFDIGKCSLGSCLLTDFAFICSYHKVPGDQCKDGFKPSADKLINLKKKCKEGDKSQIIHEVMPNDPDVTLHSKVWIHAIWDWTQTQAPNPDVTDLAPLLKVTQRQ